MHSTLLEFEELRNTRDLGGMKAEGGIIKPGKLIRSGGLFYASPEDRKKLSGLICCVVDLRNIGELEEHPSPKLARVKYVHNPLLAERAAGISREEETDEQAERELLLDFDKAHRHMSDLYRGFVSGEYSRSQIRAVIDLMLSGRRKAILWNCTAGKDRTGIIAAVIEELLGVPREDIREDYIYTNSCLESDIRALSRMVHLKFGLEPGSADAALRCHFGASMDYIDAFYDEAEKLYGSFGGYLENGLQVTPAERLQLQRMYITP